MERWVEALQSRPGWSRVRGYLFQFKTGERLELDSAVPAEELIARMTRIEVKPLSEGFPPDFHRLLVEDAVEAARNWWKEHGV